MKNNWLNLMHLLENINIIQKDSSNIFKQEKTYNNFVYERLNEIL